MRSVQKVSSHVTWKIETLLEKIQETLYVGQWCLRSLQSRHLGTSHSSPNHHQLSHPIFLNLIWLSEVSSLSKVILIWGKTRSRRTPIWAVGGLSHLGDLMFCQKNSAWDVKYEQERCHNEAAYHQLPGAVAFWIIRIVSAEEHSSLTQSLIQLCCSTHSVILNAATTQYTCSLNGIYHPHWLAQWGHHCSCMCIPVHAPWLPGCINVLHTVLVTLTMSGLFLDRPCHLLNLQYVHSCTAFYSKRCINLFNHSPLDEYSDLFKFWLLQTPLQWNILLSIPYVSIMLPLENIFLKVDHWVKENFKF